jgi:FMN phosphatase YigB (HAD superfamily)
VLAPAVVLFDLGGVLLPFDPERRIAALVQRFDCDAEVARAFMADGIHWRLSEGEADEVDLAAAFTAAFARPISPAEAVDLVMTVFETPNHALWDLVGRLRRGVTVGGFSDNPRFVDRLFPAGAFLDPMFFSSEIRAFKPTAKAFEAVEGRLAVSPGRILFVDDTPANVDAARGRGWDAVHFTSNTELMADLAGRGLA